MKVDLHVHSKYSQKPNDWFLRQIGSHESYTEPLDLYRIAKSRGMDAVTISDHNTIEGALEIRHLPDVFISCEYSVQFPNDDCSVHVVCFDITPQQHGSLLQLRGDIFAMVNFLRENRIAHTLAHPFFSPKDHLTAAHLNVLLDLFDTFELNGAKDPAANECLKRVLDTLKPDAKLTAGSDDHSSLTIARMWTEVPGASTVPEFLQGVRAGKTVIGGKASPPIVLARNIYSIGWQWLNHTGAVKGPSDILDEQLLPVERRTSPGMAERALQRARGLKPGNWRSAAAINFINREVRKGAQSCDDSMTPSERWFHIVDGITNKYLVKMGRKIVGDVARRRIISLFSYAAFPIGLHLLTSPYIASYVVSSKQVRLAREFFEHFMPRRKESRKIAEFADAFGRSGGVEQTLEQLRLDALEADGEHHMITCVSENGFRGVTNFEPLGAVKAKKFGDQTLCWPPILQMLQHCYEQGFTHIKVSSPGPVGIAGTIISKILGLPLVAVYDPDVPEFIGKQTNGSYIGKLVRQYCMWFYDRADTVLGASQSTVDRLAESGFHPKKVKPYRRGVDTDFFHPSHRSRYWSKKWRVPSTAVKALYVGQVSREKSLPLLVDALKAMWDEENGSRGKKSHVVHLMVVGEGPYLEEMRRECEGYPVVFSGSLQGEELAEAFASADFLVYPSSVDASGRIVMEAMASGIPCVVSNVGGPKESVEDGENGIVFRAESGSALRMAIRSMLYETARHEMGRNARAAILQQAAAGSSDRPAGSELGNEDPSESGLRRSLSSIT